MNPAKNVFGGFEVRSGHEESSLLPLRRDRRFQRAQKKKFSPALLFLRRIFHNRLKTTESAQAYSFQSAYGKAGTGDSRSQG